MNKQRMFLTVHKYLSLKKFDSILQFVNKYRLTLILVLILSAGFLFRIYNINWDSGHYFHPDERAIIMFASPLMLPANFEEFLSTESPLNPRFFAYGNFPLYLLKISAQLLSFFDEQLVQYGHLHLVGRVISAIFDTATIFLIFILGRRIKNAYLGVVSAFCYAIFVFPIQTSHFFAVDTMLTFFLIATLLALQNWVHKPSFKTSLMIGVQFGLSLATKVSALIFAPIIFFGIIYFVINKRAHLRDIIFSICIYAGYIATATIFVFFITLPYALIDFAEFLNQTTLQSKMSSDPFLFPYTLQYVGKIPYLYELKNIIFFGIGIPLSLSAIAGILLLTATVIRKREMRTTPAITTLLFFWIYFIAFGSFAVGWMRYMLPIYPILAIGSGFLLFKIYITISKKIPSHTLKLVGILLFAIFLIYPMSFMSIYLKPNTRVQASNWINANIPPGSSIAIEHWDDALPIHGADIYTMITLPLYEPDTEQKWIGINDSLALSDYLIIASNRLHAPLQRMTNCEDLPADRCYQRTAKYYKELFAEERGFKKVAEFSEYPSIPFVGIELNDQGADESFTVYDHPKIIIFRKANETIH